MCVNVVLFTNSVYRLTSLWSILSHFLSVCHDPSQFSRFDVSSWFAEHLEQEVDRPEGQVQVPEPEGQQQEPEAPGPMQEVRVEQRAAPC